MPVLTRKTLREWRRTLLGWTAGLCVFLTAYMAMYPSLSADPQFYGALAAAKYPGVLAELMGGLTDFVSGAGYLRTLVYQLLGPLLFILYATILANRALAVPEERRTLELTLVLPIGRRRLVLARFLALAAGLLATAVVTCAVLLASVAAYGMGVPAGDVATAHLGMYLLALVFGTLTLAVGAATGRSGLAAAVTGVWAVAGYAVVTVGDGVAVLDRLRWLSPFHYYLAGDPPYRSLPTGGHLALLGLVLALALTAVLSFDRRDVGV